jgi:hypothetical protein
MAQDEHDGLDYELLVDNALRTVVHDALKIVSKHGLPEGHHFYITFRTDHPGVDVDTALRAQYPGEMAVVLQHQFSGLVVQPDFFQVTLSFSAVPRTLVVPFAAVTSFADPDAKFALQFQSPPGLPDAIADRAQSEPDDGPEPDAETAKDDDGNIVTLDAFRKK